MMRAASLIAACAFEKTPKTLEEFLDTRCTVTPCGSRVTCDPPPTDTDYDYLVLANLDDIPSLINWLSDAGFGWEGNNDAHYKDAAAFGFMSWRKGDVNYIVTSNVDWAEKHKRATLACKRLNLMDKTDRVGLFQAVLYGK